MRSLRLVILKFIIFSVDKTRKLASLKHAVFLRNFKYNKLRITKACSNAFYAIYILLLA